MDEKIFTLVSTGLLAVIALLLVAVVARLGRLERVLRQRGESEPAAETNEPQTQAAPLPDEDASSPESVTTATPEAAGDGPYERDGRWWFRRGDELLVYDEQAEAWVDANAPRAAEAAGEPEVHPLDEARGWDTTPQEATAAPIPEPVSTPAPIATSEAPPAGRSSEESATTTPAPERVSEETATPGSAVTEPATHWKCPSCGVINGSTATSCRMCFTARP